MEVTFDKGLQLRGARHLLPPGSLLNATNLVPDTLGSLTTRQGMSLVGSIPGQDLNSYYVLPGRPTGTVTHTYQGVTNPGTQQFTLYRDFTTVLQGPVGSGGYIDFADMREFQGDRQWVFFAGGQVGLRFKDDGTVSRPWGIPAPIVAPTRTVGSGGLLNGTYTYRYIWVREDITDGIARNWSNPSVVTAPLTVTNQRIHLNSIPNPVTGPDNDGQITHAYIFRNVATAPGVHLFVGKINPYLTSTFEDNIPDLSLPSPNSLPTGLLEFDNGVPPVFSSITVYQERMWGVTGLNNRLYYSKVQRPEQFSELAYLELGPLSDTAVVVKAFGGRLYVGTDTRLIPILGNDESSYTPDNTPLPIGVTSPFSMAQGLKGLYWRGPDGVYVWNGASAQNMTDQALYPIFHQQTAHGFPPAAYGTVPFGPQDFTAGGWFGGRYYLSYATSPTGQLTTVVYDESTETWYPDHRGFRRYFYDRQREEFIGTTLEGAAYRLNQGTTDAGTPIPWIFQSRDLVEGQGNQDQSLEEITLDLDTFGSAISLTIVKDFGTSFSASAGLGASVRSQQLLEFAPESIVAKAFGYRLEGSGPFTIYRLMPRVLVFPETRLALDLLPTDLGYQGPKRIVGLTLDADLLEVGPLTIALQGDTIAQPLMQHVGIGRTQVELLQTPFDATILKASLRSPGRWRLYPSTSVSWLPLPKTRVLERMVPMDLGYPGPKQITGLWLDTELLAPGTLTITLIADGVPTTLTPQTTVGRRHANLINTIIEGTIFELSLQSTAPFRRWGGTVAWIPLPVSRAVDRILSTDLGYPGPKQLTTFWLDTEVLSAGTLTLTLLADGVPVPLTPHVGPGRRHANVLHTMVEATLIGLDMQSDAYFRIWGGKIAWSPLPFSRTIDRVLPSDLGYQGPKRIVGVWLDTELLAPGVMTPTLQVDGNTIPLTPQTTVGRREEDVLGTTVDGTLIGLSFSATAAFRRWSTSHLTWVPLPPEYLVYNWPASTLGTADEKLLQAVSLDIEIMDPATVTLTVIIDGTSTFNFSASGPGRYTTGRLRFPRTAHGKTVEYRMTSVGHWRLWGGEFLYQRLGSRENLQRFPLISHPGSTGPSVQRAPLGGPEGSGQETPFPSGVSAGQGQETPLPAGIPQGLEAIQRTSLVGSAA